MPLSPPRGLVAGLALVLVGSSACSMARLRQDLAEIEELGLITGTVNPAEDASSAVVILFRDEPSGAVPVQIDRLSAGLRDYIFTLPSDESHFAVAFRDDDLDGVPDATEPVGTYGYPGGVSLEPLERRRGCDIALTERPKLVADMEDAWARIDDSLEDTIPIASGEVTTLDDPRFTAEEAKAGMWTPLSTLRKTGGGVYFLERYDPERIPVLFVHGIGGSPRDFEHVVGGLDRSRFQAWVYHYPSGIRLPRAAAALDRIVAGLEEKLGFERLFVTAHSMGGLVSRRFLLDAEGPVRDAIRLFVTFSTPWNGHRAAGQGVKYAPAVVPSWIDVTPDSEYLASLREELPSHVPHHLFFGYHTKRNPLMLYSHDTVVSVASQLAPWAQFRAERSYGYDRDHIDILADEDALATFYRILQRTAIGP